MGEGREEVERNIDMRNFDWLLLPLTHPDRGRSQTQACVLTGNGTNQQTFALRAQAQATEPHWSRLFVLLLLAFILC